MPVGYSVGGGGGFAFVCVWVGFAVIGRRLCLWYCSLSWLEWKFCSLKLGLVREVVQGSEVFVYLFA